MRSGMQKAFQIRGAFQLVTCFKPIANSKFQIQNAKFLNGVSQSDTPLPGVRLRGDARGRGRRCRGIAKVVMPEGRQAVVQLVHERNPGRDVELDDFRDWNGVQVFDQRAQAVAVCGDEHPFPGSDGWRDGLVPVRQEPRDRVFQRFGERQLGWRQVRVARIARFRTDVYARSKT